jgi:DNA-binding HxlR family transcriptional regulator
MSKRYTPTSAAHDVEAALHLLEGRWKLVILFHLFGGKVLRFSDLERAIPTITQKMLGQQLRRLEADGIVVRTVYPQIPPKVEYSLTEWGQALCPALDAILTWADLRPQPTADLVYTDGAGLASKLEATSMATPEANPLPMVEKSPASAC